MSISMAMWFGHHLTPNGKNVGENSMQVTFAFFKNMVINPTHHHNSATRVL
jgi:hypothetical protein